jgi:hypothetical protein
MRTRTEFMAIPIVALVLGVVFLVLLTSKAGAWGWVIFGAVALVALAAVLAVAARRHPHPSELDAPATRARAPGDGTHRVLVVSDGSSTSGPFRDEVLAGAAGKPVEVLVIVPALGSRLSRWTGDDQARHEAEADLERTLSALSAAGIAARGEVGSDDPIEAADDALREFRADAIVFATHPEEEANWKERGVIETAQSRYDLPVTQLTVDPEP